METNSDCTACRPSSTVCVIFIQSYAKASRGGLLDRIGYTFPPWVRAQMLEVTPDPVP